jgi:D-beta-D-heptose 7-phosphate kinase/D-beta-D-heptose 1-phosphate adenosyltransferase
VAVKDEEYTLGGSGNVVNNLSTLGAKVSVAGVIGAGGDGDLVLEKFKGMGIDTDCIITEAKRVTTRKTRILAANQQVIRIDRETKKDLSAKTSKKLVRMLMEKVSLVDAVLISDYGKGVVTSTVISEIVSEAKKHNKTIIADPKGLDFSKYAGVSLLTPNKKEAGAAAGIDITTESDLLEAGNKILKDVKIDSLLITCGKDGMVLFERGEVPYKISGEARQVYDVSGAGDTVLAVLGLSLASGSSLRDAAALANTAAGIVVGKIGTATVSANELAFAMNPFGDAVVIKEKRIAELAGLSKELERQGKTIVLTNGCFDLLHAGHVQLFSASKQLGDVLVVAIDDDDSVRELKGQGRPVLRAHERVRILSALDSIDHVVVFAKGELDTVIENLRPSVVTKGSNYQSDEVYGHELIKKSGGRIELIPVIENFSSTSIINNIKNSRPS